MVNVYIDLEATGKHMKQMMKPYASVKEWASIIGLTTTQHIYRWWKGRNLPRIDNLAVIADVLGVRIDDLLVIRKGE